MELVSWGNLCRASVLIPALHLTPGSALADCGAGQASKPATVPLSALTIQQPLYLFEGDGSLSKLDLATGRTSVVATHAFKSSPHVAPSPNFRWISYHGVLKNEKATEYWLFDRQTGKSRLVHSHPAWGGSIPAFSPDSKLLAIAANYDRRWPSKEGAAIFLFDSGTLTPTRLPNPSQVAIPENLGFAHLYWSKDGGELLAMMRGFPKGQQGTREHFAYRMSDRVFEKISGTYDPRQEIFSRAGARIDLASVPTIQSRISHGRLPSPDGKWKAELDRKLVLTVSSANGDRKTVAAGSYDNCRGPTVGIHGWLNDRLMVYSLDDEFYVFEASTGQQALMFSKSSRPADFFW